MKNPFVISSKAPVNIGADMQNTLATKFIKVIPVDLTLVEKYSGPIV